MNTEIITYNLSNTNNDGLNFYDSLKLATDEVLRSGAFFKALFVSEFRKYIIEKNIEKVRSEEEYFLEYLTIGILWRNYASTAYKTSKQALKINNYLYQKRSSHPKLKKSLDSIRGKYAYLFLNKDNSGVVEVNKENLQVLSNWLDATGEFSEEVIRINNWIEWFNTFQSVHSELIIRKSIEFSDFFVSICDDYMGKYLPNLNTFLASHNKNYKYKEDYFFTKRSKDEYFINMIGSELLNRAFKEEFDGTNYKTVLLPSCMRPLNGDNCKAHEIKGNFYCSGCNLNCNIYKIDIELRKLGYQSCIMPHSSGFSKFLSQWKNQNNTGLVGVACTLNLLKGGYEMKKLEIPSQCVLLDFCGCKKHWSKNGVATNLNIEQLKNILSKENTMQEAFKLETLEEVAV